jgi:hypothetical protein
MYIEKRQAGALPISDRIQLKIHLKLCDACKMYSEQSALIDAFLKKQYLDSEPDPETLEQLRKAILLKHLGI